MISIIIVLIYLKSLIFDNILFVRWDLFFLWVWVLWDCITIWITYLIIK